MNKPFTNQISAPTALPGAADVRIARIETIPLKVRLDRTANGSNLLFTHRCAIVTRIHTDAGVIGECFNGNDDELQGDIIKVIAEEMAPKLIGRRVLAIEEAWDSPAPRPSRSCATGASRCARRPASTARCMTRSASSPACRCT